MACEEGNDSAKGHQRERIQVGWVDVFEGRDLRQLGTCYGFGKW